MFFLHAACALARMRRRRPPRYARFGGIGRKLLTFLVMVVVLVGALPFIVAKTPLRHVLLSMAVPSDVLRVTIGEASLNWIGTPALSQIDVKDPSGESLLAVEAVR